MALPLTGTITSSMILTELGFTGSSNVLRNVVQKPGGILQVLVNSTWVNLNMCSPYLPIPIAPYIVPTHWYGYNHGTTGVELLTISGDNTIDVGQTVTYTASITGDNLSGVVLTWSKFEAGSWNDNIATGTSLTVTWTDPRDAKIRVIASNICNLNIVKKELDISYNCTPALTGDPYIGGTLEVNKSYDVWAVNGSGIVGDVGNTRLGITFFWEVFGSVQIISGQGTNKVVIRATATSTNNIIKVTITSCSSSYTSSNITFDASSPVTVYYNTAQSTSIQKICPSGQVGSYVTVTRAAGTHSSTVDVATANAAAVAWLSTQDAQNIAQAEGNCGNTVSYPNDRRTQLFTKYCTSGVGTQVEYVVPANKYFAASVSAANALAQAEIDANGQNKANAEGQCIIGCTRIVTGVSATYSTGSGVINNINITGTVLEAGFYSVKIKFNNAEYNSSYFFSGSGSFPDLNVTGTGQLIITISSECSSMSWTSSTFTVTGAVVCTNGLVEASPTKSYFGSGVYTVAIGLTAYQNVSNVSGRIELKSGGSTLQTDYFSELDFSSGATVYQSFPVPVGSNWTVSVHTFITSGTNLCSSSNFLSGGTITIVNPV